MKKVPKYIHQDLLMALILLLISIFFMVGSFLIPHVDNPSANIHTYPQLISGMLMVFSIMSIPPALKATRELNEKVAAGEPVKKPISWQELKYPVIGAGIILLYIIGVCVIGFFVSSAVFLIAMPFYLGYRKLHVLIPLIIGLEGFIYLLFVQVLYTRLPAGLLF